jgi:hypothetical protein
MHRFAIAVGVFLLCSEARPATTCAPIADDDLSRRAFLREVLFASKSPRTPRFEDGPDIYQLDPKDMTFALGAEARQCGLQLEGAVVLGPVGELWTYWVIALVRDGDDDVRVNVVVVPHARITMKRTALLPAAWAAAFLEALQHAPGMRWTKRPLYPAAFVVRTGLGAWAAEVTDRGPREERPDLFDQIDAMVMLTQKTY